MSRILTAVNVDVELFSWTGTVKGDEIAFSRTPDGGQAQTFTAKRQK